MTFAYKVIKLNYLTDTHLQVFLSPINETMEYEAGQYLTLQYPSGEFMPFSIANAPNSSRQLELHIRVAKNDQPTLDLIHIIKESTKIDIKGPFGDCRYEKGEGPILLLAAGTGFAPAKAIIEKIIAQQKIQECFLYWTVKTEDDFYLAHLPKLWQHTLNDFHYVPVCTRTDLVNKQTVIELIKNQLSDLSVFRAYVFGPPALAWDALKVLSEKGLKKENFYTDVLSEAQILEWRQVT